jgi:hypothetical protein
MKITEPLVAVMRIDLGLNLGQAVKPSFYSKLRPNLQPQLGGD